MLHAATALRAAMEQVLRPLGMSVTHYSCLELLAQRPGLSNSELARGAFVTRQSMTVYTMDGDRLLATHYCPQGNAPRLRLEGIDASGAYRFEFVNGAHLQDPQGSHEHAFWLRIDAAGTITRGETYVRNGSAYDPSRDMGEVETFVRTK